jgi:hypothetical protein
MPERLDEEELARTALDISVPRPARARLSMSQNHPVRLPDAVKSPGREIPAGEVNQERPGGGSDAEPLRFPLALEIIDDPDLPPELVERAGQMLGEPRIGQRLREPSAARFAHR